MNPSHGLADEIRQRGYWWIRIRPASYVGNKIEYSDLLTTLRLARVQLTGWDFPHIGREEELIRGPDHIGFDTDWYYYREVVRFWQSGQFSYLVGIREDWYERGSPTMWRPPSVKPGDLLGLGDTVTTYNEVFEFAARLSETRAGDENMVISVQLSGLRGRQLYAENPARHLMGSYVAQIPSWEIEKMYARQELLGRAADLAAKEARALFARFGAELELDTVRDIQRETRRV